MSDEVVIDQEPEEANRTRLLLLIALGVAALLALIVFVILPLLTGDEPERVVEEDGTDVGVVDGSEAPTPTPTEDFELARPGAGGGGAPAETFEVFSARDPFQQLVRDGEGGNGGGAPNPTPADPTPGVTPQPPADPGAPTVPGGTPTASPSPAPPPGDGTGTDTGDGNGDGNGTGNGGGTGTGDGSDGDDPPPTGGGGDDNDDDGSANVGGTTVTLVDVFTGDDGERKATVTVNGSGYNVGEGATFASRFRLLDISGSCSTMLFGDSRFTLCEGERIRK